GLANQPASVSADDGLRLRGAYVTAVNRCPPPQNRPTTEERDNCLPYLVRELRLLHNGRVIVALGSFAWTGSLLALAEIGAAVTTFGKLMDPIADKLLVAASLIALVSLDRLAAWIAMVIIAREFAVTGLRMVAAERGVVIQASWLGKVKTILQVAAIICLIAV